MAHSKPKERSLSLPARSLFSWNPFSRSDKTLSPVPHLLNSNAAPSESEAEAITHFVSSLQHALEVLEAQSAKDTASTSVNKRKDTLKETIALHLSLLSPIRRLPVELLELVFFHAYDGHTRNHYTLRWADLPLAISQVSQRWREIAINLSHLWNRLPNVDFKRLMRCGWTLAREVMTELLRRSKRAPLHFSYSCPNTRYVPGNEPVLDVLVAHCKRWDTVHIETSMKTLAHVMYPIARRLRRLKKLTLKCSWSEGVDSVDVFAVAPALKEVFLIDTPTDRVYLPWKQLTFFKESTRKGTAAIFDNLDKLTHLELTRYNHGLPTFRSQLLPNLTILRIRFGTDSNGNEVLANLTLPVLEELIIFRHPHNVIPAIESLVERSSPTITTTLRSMSLRTRYYQEGELTRLLEMLPRLSKLEIRDPPVVDLQNFVIQENAPIVLVPNLRFFVLSDLSCIKSIKDIIHDISRTRCEDGILLHDDDNNYIFGQGQFAQLRRFRLAFGYPYASFAQCHKAQMALNNWDTPPFQNEVSVRLVDLASVLCREIPAMPGQFEHCIGYRLRFLLNPQDPSHASRINDVFTELEKFELKDVNDLYPSQLHMLLDWISTGPADKIAGESRYQIKARAAALLKQWEPRLKTEASSARWVTLSRDIPAELRYVASYQTAPERTVGDDAHFDEYDCLLETCLDGIEDVTPRCLWETEMKEIRYWSPTVT